MYVFDHKKIEAKWQKVWERTRAFAAREGSKRKKFYLLVEFPYPSGDGLHVGHIRSYTALDIVARKKRRQGMEVLYPMGWDAFGLPTENYAIKTGIHPRIITKRNTDTFRRQLKSMGFSFDWSREVNTSDPLYYRWTQWIFLQLFKKGLAYKARRPINWCLSCKIGLADEEVVDDRCERCGGPVEKRDKEQWMLAITRYAERLYTDLDTVNFLPKITTQQRNWIGRSEGSRIRFAVADHSAALPSHIEVFTTRADTLFGAACLVLAPEHPFVSIALHALKNKAEVEAYTILASQKTEIDRTAEGREKTGILLKGVMAVNPANQEHIPIFIADYVLAHYGTGAIMAVPAHDERDFEFAKKFKLHVRQVVCPTFGLTDKRSDAVVRHTVTAIVKRADGKVLMLQWKEPNPTWLTPIIGGREGKESPEVAAVREVKEETGYATRVLAVSPCVIESHFYAEHKQEWRGRYDTPVLLELTQENPGIVSTEERAKHASVWMTPEEAIARTSFNNNKLALEMMLKGNHGYEGSAYTEQDLLINSGRFDGLSAEKAKAAITRFVGGKKETTFKLRDWVFSRQRYWGEPIPMIRCEECARRKPGSGGWVPVPEKDLPVKLPDVKSYQPGDTGESPLAGITSFVNVKCPVCKSPARRETDVMPNWAGSSWYFLRYADPKNRRVFADKKKLKYWTPVDWYNGGMEHTTLHLLYSRFWHKFLYDLKLVPSSEPYAKRTSHGLILAEGGVKMSKSKGNVINPDGIVSLLGADTLRVYEMFMGPFDQQIAWNSDSIAGVRRFLERVYKLSEKLEKKTSVKKGPPARGANNSPELEVLMNQTIKKVGEDIDELKMNTALSTLMILTNELEKLPQVSREQYGTLLQLLAPFAPHVCEELWQKLGEKKSIHASAWPKFNPGKLETAQVTIAVQVNGRVRATLSVRRGTKEGDVSKAALGLADIKKWLEGKTPRRIIFVPNKILNVIV